MLVHNIYITVQIKVGIYNRSKMEVCVDNVQSALNAAAGGANRLELCCALSEGGLTPSLGLFCIVKKLVNLPVFVMIRPTSDERFRYTCDELDVMKIDLKLFKDHGADGFVFGMLGPSYNVDAVACKTLLDIASPLPVTFHRAFDFVSDPFKALDLLIDLGFKRILTSGQAETAEKGHYIIKRLIKAAKCRIIVMPGGGINVSNLKDLLRKTKATEFHGSAKRNLETDIGDTGGLKLSTNKSFTPTVTDVETVKAMVKISADVNKERLQQHRLLQSSRFGQTQMLVKNEMNL